MTCAERTDREGEPRGRLPKGWSALSDIPRQWAGAPPQTGGYRHSFSQVFSSMVTPGSTSTGVVPAGRKPRFLQKASA